MEAQSAAQGARARGVGGAASAQPLPALLQHLHDLVVGSDDYVRKPLLVSWLQGQLAGPRPRAEPLQGVMRRLGLVGDHLAPAAPGVGQRGLGAGVTCVFV